MATRKRPPPKADKKVLGTKAAAAYAEVGTRAILAALESGDLGGRNLGGSTGWITTTDELDKWAAGRSAKEERAVKTSVDEGGAGQ